MDYLPYLSLLKKELVPATGCTEPAAIALAVSRTMDIWKGSIEDISVISVELSKSIYKNAFAVTIPGTKITGSAYATALGAVINKSEAKMEILSYVTKDYVDKAKKLVDQGIIKIIPLEKAPASFFIHVTILGKEQGKIAWTWTTKSHENIVKAVSNGEDIPVSKWLGEYTSCDNSSTTEDIDLKNLELSDLIDIVKDMKDEELIFIEDSITMNRKVMELGLSKDTGLNIGKTIEKLEKKGYLKEDILTKVRKAVAAAGDARMGGQLIPVMTTTGSGNQGILISLSIDLVAKEYGISNQIRNKGLALANLITAFVKQYMGRLTPLCGCGIASGIGVAGGVTYMLGGTKAQIEAATRNMLANLAGMLCDGAKDGCAFKLASSASEAIVAAFLALEDVSVKETDGIVGPTLKATAINLYDLCMDGMKEQDQVMVEILNRK